MEALRLLSALVIFSIWASCASAEYTPKYQSALAATAAEFPHLDFIWANAEGDLDGDGLPDLALVLTGNRGADGPREERLIVLVGKPDGSYKILSVSDEFCHVRKFYNLSTSQLGSSFEVEGVSSGDASHSDSFTLKFRYNVNFNDFELVGREDRSTNYDEDSSYRVSINYLTAVAIQTRHLGKNYIERRYTADGTEEIVQHSRRSSKHKEVKTEFNGTVLFRLQGFDCSRYLDEDPAAILPIHIDEDFKVQRK
jgi:hypothetical protein